MLKDPTPQDLDKYRLIRNNGLGVHESPITRTEILKVADTYKELDDYCTENNIDVHGSWRVHYIIEPGRKI